MEEKLDTLIATLCDYISQRTDRRDNDSARVIAEDIKLYQKK